MTSSYPPTSSTHHTYLASASMRFSEGFNDVVCEDICSYEPFVYAANGSMTLDIQTMVMCFSYDIERMNYGVS